MKVKKIFSVMMLVTVAAMAFNGCKKEEPKPGQITIDNFIGTYSVKVVASAMGTNLAEPIVDLVLTKKDTTTLTATTSFEYMGIVAVDLELSAVKAVDGGFLFKIEKQVAVDMGIMGTVELEGTDKEADGYDGSLKVVSDKKVLDFAAKGDITMLPISIPTKMTLTINGNKK